MKWFATAAQIVGATMLASRLSSPVGAYVIMTMGSLSWAHVARRDRDGPLLALNLAFTALNFVGLWRWWTA